MKHENYGTHVQIVASLLIAGNAVMIFLGVVAMFFLLAFGRIIHDTFVMRLFDTVGITGALLLTVLALPGLIAGFGLFKREPWGRILALVAAFLGLANFPVGTAIGGYAFWVLLQDDADQYFAPLKPA